MLSSGLKQFVTTFLESVFPFFISRFLFLYFLYLLFLFPSVVHPPFVEHFLFAAALPTEKQPSNNKK
jgi:hypothetical protein